MARGVTGRTVVNAIKETGTVRPGFLSMRRNQWQEPMHEVIVC